MIKEDERNLISILCASQKKPESLISFSISKTDGIRCVSTFDTGTIVVKLNKTAIRSEQDTSFAVSSDRLRSIMSWMPSGDIEIKLNGNSLIMSSGKSKREITVSDLDDIISEVAIDEDKEDSVMIMNKEKFMEGLNFANFFKHKDPERPVGYSLLRMNGKKVYLIGSDGNVLGFYLYSQKFEFPEIQILLGEQQCASMLSVMKESKNVQMKFDGKRFGVFGENISFVGMQPAFDITDYIKMIDILSPRRSDSLRFESHLAVVNTEDLKRAASHCGSIFAKDEYPYIDMSFEKENLIVSAKSSAKGFDSVHEEVKCNSTSEKSIRLSPVLLNKALIKYEKICEISWRKDGNMKSPICISYPSEDTVSSFVLLAPRMVKSSEEE